MQPRCVIAYFPAGSGTVGNGAKSGYCFMDTTAYRLSLAGAPQRSVYGGAGCGEQSSTNLSMGLSVGWGDRYGWTLSDQYVDGRRARLLQ